MKGNARHYQTAVVYDEAEVRRRMGQVYTLLLELARERRLRNQQTASAQADPAGSNGLV
jgi:hypothetical protein